VHRQGGRPAGMSAGTIVVAYVISAVLWIALSDRVLGALVSDPGALATMSTLKGWAFVALTGAMLAAMLRRRDAQRARQAGELEAREAREVRRVRERALIADALEALRPLDTAEQTAEAICSRVVELPEIAMASLLLLEPDGGAMPLALTVDDGRVLERKNLGSERSAQLRTRAGQGPWVEAWRPRAGHPYLADHLAIGLRGQAYSPIRSGATLIGLLTVGSREPDAVALLTERLPAILEFASLAGALLAPSVAMTGAMAASRTRIERIVATGAFHPVFQPMVDLATRGPIGYEALTRFDDGTPPDLVFAEARRCGLDRELESVTLGAALAASERLPVGFLSLNVSPAFILAGVELRAILAARTRPIVLEVTEHDTIDDYGALRSAFVALGSGLRLAVDDAGAGIANFNHLVELQPQFVKVDIGLVRGVNADLTRQALIVALLHFAGATDCHVVAEGIETEAERAVLEKLEIQFGQGYLFGRPAEASTWAAPAAAPSTLRRGAALRAISGGRRPRARAKPIPVR
jgi:EAL domain-containing protein (putative c-di-GMP-specific phosphodiesterase class I)